jgi:prophage maintenance system killer protein
VTTPSGLVASHVVSSQKGDSMRRFAQGVIAFLAVAAYVTVHAKAVALLHSVVRNRALVDGNKRLGLAAVIAFYGLNGRRLTMSNDEAYNLVMSVASGSLDDVALIAQQLESGSKQS